MNNQIKEDFKSEYLEKDGIYMVSMTLGGELVAYTKKMPENRTVPFSYKGSPVRMVESSPISTF